MELFVVVVVLIGWVSLQYQLQKIQNRHLIVTLDVTEDEIVWEQPANTIIQTSFVIRCAKTAHISYGDIGVRIGTTSGGMQITHMNYCLLHNGTTVPENAVFQLYHDGFSLLDKPDPEVGYAFTATNRKLYFQMIHNSDILTRGKFTLHFTCLALS